MRVNISSPPRLAYGEDDARPATPGAPDVQVAVVNMMQGRVEAVCKRLGWSTSTLQKKISLTNDGYHVSISELQMLQHVTGDMSPTQALAAAEGYACIRITPGVAGSVAEGIACLMVAAADFARDAQQSTEGGRALSRNDLRRADHLVGELMGAANALAAHLRTLAPVPPPGVR